MSEKNYLDLLNKLRQKEEKQRSIGLISFYSGILLLLLLIFISSYVEASVFSIILFLSLILATFGLFYTVMKSFGVRNMIRAYKIIADLEPESITVTEKYIIARKGEIHILTLRGVNGIYFMKFLHYTYSSTKKARIKVPKVFPVWHFRQSRDLSMVKRKGIFTAPIDSQLSIRGEAILYFLPLETLIAIDRTRMYVPVEYSKHNLQQLIQQLLREESS